MPALQLDVCVCSRKLRSLFLIWKKA